MNIALEIKKLEVAILRSDAVIQEFEVNKLERLEDIARIEAEISNQKKHLDKLKEKLLELKKGA